MTGLYKRRRPNQMVTTFALGTRRLYDWLDENVGVEFLPVDFVNDPRVIADRTELRLHQCHDRGGPDRPGRLGDDRRASYWSGSGGQADFAKGAMLAEGGQGFIVLRSTTSDGAT